VIAAGLNAFHGGFQQGDHPAFAALVGRRGWNPDDLWRFGFHQEHEVERGRGFADGFQQQLVADELDFVVEGGAGRIVTA